MTAEIPEQADPAALTSRIARLERKVRYTQGLVFVWIALVVVLEWNILHRREVILSNEVSQTTAAFEPVGDGRIGLYFFDKNHNVRAELGLSSEGSPTLILKDKDGSVLFKAP